MKSNNEHIIDNSIFRIGKVLSIEGRSIKVSIDKGKNTSHLLYKGDILQNISVGGYIKISKGFIEMIAKIEGESINEDKKVNKKEYSSNKEKIKRYLIVKLLGYIEEGKFTRGVKELPLVDNECFLLKREEFNLIHNFVDEENDVPLRVGSLTYDDGQEINIGINSIFASHIGIFGNTGSGKSYTLAKVYHQLFNKYKGVSGFKNNAEFYFIDFNGEYTGKNAIIDGEYKNVYNLTTRKELGHIKEDDKYPIREKSINDPVFWSIFLEATEKTQLPFLKRSINDSYIIGKLNTDNDFKELISEKLYSIVTENDLKTEKSLVTDLLYEIGSYLGNNESIKEIEKYFRDNLRFHGNKNSFILDDIFANDNPTYFKDKIDEKINTLSNLNIHTLSFIQKIGLTIIIKYYDEMIRGFSNREHLSPLIKRLEKRVKDLEKVITVIKTGTSSKNITVVSLRDVNLGIRKMIPMLISKELYDNKKENKNEQSSLHLIIDEAHNILSKNSDRESEQWKDYRLETFEEIIKEGRKFGVFLTIASQRPSDISPTIISQLHNYFLHRLINNNDIIAVEKTIAYLDKVSAESLPILPTGNCILAGLFAQIPVIVSIDKIGDKYKPNNETICLTDGWVDLEGNDNAEEEISVEDIPF